jgi:hypothetical protein
MIPVNFGDQWIFVVLALWTLPWKGWALWKAAKREDKTWFVVLFLVNTFAVLDILYIYIWSKRKPKTEDN